MRLNTGFIIHFYLLGCLCDYVKASIYFAEQQTWDISEVFKCRGTPNLQAQRIQFLEDAASTYYKTLMAGRFLEDRHLDTFVPPASVLGDKAYLALLQMAVDSSEKYYGSSLLMTIGCVLYNDLEWVNTVYNGPLSRNTDTFRAILDTIYRIMLCIKNIEPELNCPDPCRGMPENTCEKTANAVGSCSTYEEDVISKSVVQYTTNDNLLEKRVKKWLRIIPIARRLPVTFFTFDLDYEGSFDRRHDRTIGGCVDESEETLCGGANPCANGGHCIRLALMNQNRSELDSAFKCICAPAFGGETCQGEIDPCIKDNVCGEFPCIRDPYELHNGYRCICPSTHKPKDTGDPRCVPQPACGEMAERFHLGEPSDMDQPCLNNGQCLQDETNPSAYTCLCPKGFSGKNCEMLPPPAVWSSWSGWSDCQWPEPQEICYKRGYQERTRLCVVQSLMQRCIGPERVQRHSPCDLAMNSVDTYSGISITKRQKLIEALDLCGVLASGSILQPGEEELGETLLTWDDLDDWSMEGPETAPEISLPDALRQGQIEAINWPRMQDLVFMAAWIYAVLIHIAFILLWIYYIHRWRHGLA